jgi:glutaredoxin 3
MTGRARFLVVVTSLIVLIAGFAQAAKEVPKSPAKPAAPVASYPKIVLYSASWCPHCKQAKEYFAENNIPYINKDVEDDEKAMDDVKIKYKSLGIPVIVIGNDEKVLKRFNKEEFEKAVSEVQQKKK